MGFKVERRTVHPWGADGPPANLRFVPERLFLWFGLKSELRTVRPWGANGPQANSFLDQRACLSLVKSVLFTADGPPLGRGRSARAVTASSDTQSLHSDSLGYNGGQSGF